MNMLLLFPYSIKAAHASYTSFSSASKAGRVLEYILIYFIHIYNKWNKTLFKVFIYTFLCILYTRYYLLKCLRKYILMYLYMCMDVCSM